ncbi:hypothetical protein [Amycolatopsis sp. lyj-108]|uniref:hypothetical protein n=1 Tax=Amycolatopsis sp. lyj-108 TaxID=2789286 RepID=UPI00397CE601
MTTSFDEHCDALILHIHETGQQVVVDDFLTERGFDEATPTDLVQDLENRGLVHPTYTLGEVRCRLTGAGVRRAQQLINERPKRRATTLRHRMLQWLEEHPESPNWDEFLASDQVRFEGTAFTEAQLKREAKHLYDLRYITAATIDEEVDGVLWPDITASGRDFLFDGNQRSGNTFTTTIHHGPVINGPVTKSQLAWENTTAHQDQHPRASKDDR